MRTIPNKLRFYIGALLALALIVGLAMPMQTALAALPAPTIVYDAITNPLAPNYPSLGFQATQTAEFGDYIHLAGTNRVLQDCHRHDERLGFVRGLLDGLRYMGDSANWTHPITVNIYSNHLGVNGVPDTLLGTVTQVSTIPWRPVADPTCATAHGVESWRWHLLQRLCLQPHVRHEQPEHHAARRHHRGRCLQHANLGRRSDRSGRTVHLAQRWRTGDGDGRHR